MGEVRPYRQPAFEPRSRRLTIALLVLAAPALAQMPRAWFCAGEAERESALVALMNEVGGLQDKQEFNQAQDRIQAALAADPNNPLLNAVRAEVLIVSNNNDDAAHLLREVLRAHPDSAIAHELLAVALDPADPTQRDEIGKQQKIALELKPCMPLAHANAGFTFIAKHEFAAAADEFRRAIGASPDYATAYRGLGESLLSLGQRDEALAQFRRAVELLPGSWTTHASLADALIVCRMVEEGLAEYRVAVQLSANNPGLRFQYSKALAAAGKRIEALRQLVGVAAGWFAGGNHCQVKRIGEQPQANTPPSRLLQIVRCLIAAGFAPTMW